MDYEDYALFFRALSDENRLKIMDMLSCGEICACEILLELDITQSTLSHHMKILCDCALVVPRRAGKWTYYSQNKAAIKSLKDFIGYVSAKREKCICNLEKDDDYE
ncbi:MAG: metalloregulator ArsR/SmtB family transcription factor [Treponema sp.]|nr:metalloregulator ArsR/SmtB family transcription factor [Treponema sp.]